MTYKQNEQWRKLQQDIADAYNEFQSNTEQAKRRDLFKAWQNAIEIEEIFTNKFN